MTSEEMTTGSVSATEAERQYLASRSRWWNSTCGGSASSGQKGNIKAGDGGKKFQDEFPEIHKQNLDLMQEKKIDLETGNLLESENEASKNCGGPIGLARPSGSAAAAQLVVDGREAGGSWLRRNKLYVFGGLIFAYVLIARMLGTTEPSQSV